MTTVPRLAGNPVAAREATAPRTVLLVEDDPADVFLVQRMLASVMPEGCQVHVAERLARAVQHLDAHPVDCVVLDLSLPDGLGLETVEVVRRSAPDVPIIVLSALQDEQLAIRSLQHGVQDYLTKGEVDGRLLWRSMCYAVERKRTELALQHQARHDPLTGLANRSVFVDALSSALARLAQVPGLVAVLFVDLDRFKWVNDSLGHGAGDELLVQVAARLRAIVRPGDLVARFGGDEFLVLVRDLQSTEEAVLVSGHLHTALTEPFPVGHVEVQLSASIGIAVSGDPGSDADGLLGDADAAMYRAKSRGKARSEMFDEELREAAQARLTLESDLHRAVERSEFEVHYQPIVSLDDGRIVSVEALVRWRHPSGRLVPPSEFIPVAEEMGAIVSIGDLVLRTACEQLRRWGERVPDPPTMAVNLSARQLADPGLADRVAEIVTAAGLTAGQLYLEVTETSILEDEQAALACLLRLKQLGVGLAIDDFGTGYSSLSYLKLYPFDLLKVDRAFTAGLGADDHDTAIVSAIAGLGQCLDLKVIGEGVETAQQAALLRELGCGLAQGYHFARPSPGGQCDISTRHAIGRV